MTISARAGGALPYVLISGPEVVLVERAVASIVEALRVDDPALEVIKLYSEGYQSGPSTMHAAPPRFGRTQGHVVHRPHEPQ